ncbi:MAG: RNA polymerase sigma factor, partial [Planctomycetes bacterium]|nr:RNA polymerase sigma factor [Planctomycetota bacterium]
MSQADGVAKFIRGAAGTGPNDVPDAELVRRFAAAGDEQAFRALVARYGPVVWSVCRRLVRDHHDAEDAFQATLLVFARKAGDLRADSAVGGWLYAVAHRVASRVRSMRRAEPAETEPSDGPPGGALDELTVREAESALHDELARLPEKYRAPLVLCCLEGLSRDEAAVRLGWSANRVKHGLEQGRERLRVRLARRGIALGVPLLTGSLASPAGAVPPPLVEAAVRHATGSTPPAAVRSLANGATRTMWLTKWKWAAAGFAALALTAGGALAAILHTAPPDAPRAGPVANAEPLLAPRAPVPKPKMEEPRGPWEVATEYLQLAIADKPEEARKLCDDKAAEHIREVKSSGLKRVKFAAVLLNDQRARVVTGREPLKRHLGVGQPDNGDHFCVTLERKDGAGPWRVIGNEHLDGKSVWGATTPDGPEANQYLLSGYDVLPDPAKPNRADGAAKAPKADWDVASEFLRLALAGKTDDALKLAVPGTV